MKKILIGIGILTILTLVNCDYVPFLYTKQNDIEITGIWYEIGSSEYKNIKKNQIYLGETNYLNILCYDNDQDFLVVQVNKYSGMNEDTIGICRKAYWNIDSNGNFLIGNTDPKESFVESLLMDEPPVETFRQQHPYSLTDGMHIPFGTEWEIRDYWNIVPEYNEDDDEDLDINGLTKWGDKTVILGYPLRDNVGIYTSNGAQDSTIDVSQNDLNPEGMDKINSNFYVFGKNETSGNGIANVYDSDWNYQAQQILDGSMIPFDMCWYDGNYYVLMGESYQVKQLDWSFMATGTTWDLGTSFPENMSKLISIQWDESSGHFIVAYSYDEDSPDDDDEEGSGFVFYDTSFNVLDSNYQNDIDITGLWFNESDNIELFDENGGVILKLEKK